jgi:hypothetical protein
MGTLSKFGPIGRAVAVMGVTAGMVTGVTFAALNSTATLTNNTISTADTSLLLWDGDSFEATAPGFTITDLVPGQGTDPQVFYFQNTSDLNEKVTARVINAPSAEGFTGWENLKVTFTDLNSGETNSGTFQDLLNNEFNLPNSLDANAMGNNQSGEEDTEGNYSVTFDIDPAAVTGDSASVGSFDLTFTATPAAAPAPEEDL